MPELPDVEVFKRHLDSTSMGQRIETVKVRNDKVLEGTTEKKLRQALSGKR
ncbi:MAG: DNA-formamidopyrimidine glycosylase family protein [bacterium]